MKSQKIIVDGVEKDIVVKLDDDFKDDSISINLEDTMTIPTKEIKDTLEDTNVINLEESDANYE